MRSKLAWILVAVVCVLLLLYAGGSWYFSTILMSRSAQTVAESRTRMEEAGISVAALPPPEDVAIQSGEIVLSGHFYENERSGECAVLLLHGYTGARYGVMQYAPLFWQRGCDLLAYDARGHGESSHAFHTYGYYEKQDGLAAYQWLRERTGLAPQQVGLTGVSYGAATVLQMLPLAPDAAFVLADSPYQDLRTIVSHQAAAQFGDWATLFVPGAFLIAGLRANFDADEVSPQTAVANTTVPILLIHSRTDAFTPYTNSEAIYNRSNPATTTLFINDWGSAHARDILTDYPAYEQIVNEFLGQYAPAFGSGDGR